MNVIFYESHIFPVELQHTHTHTHACTRAHTHTHTHTHTRSHRRPLWASPFSPILRSRKGSLEPKAPRVGWGLWEPSLQPIIYEMTEWKVLQGNPSHALWCVENAASSSPFPFFSWKAQFEGTGNLEGKNWPPASRSSLPPRPPRLSGALIASAPMGQQLLHPFPLPFTPSRRKEVKQNSKNNCQHLKRRKA